jgi:hypothetical protein
MDNVSRELHFTRRRAGMWCALSVRRELWRKGEKNGS